MNNNNFTFSELPKFPSNIDPLELNKARYRKTIKKHKWEWDYEDHKLIYHSPEEILDNVFYQDELWYEDNGKFRTHKIELDKQQKELKIDFLKRNIIALLTIKLPSKSSCGFTRTRKESTATEKTRFIIRAIERFMADRNHWEKDPCFDFVCVMEHGKNNIWHCHMGIIPLMNININEFMYKLREACNAVKLKYDFGRNVIDLELVYDKEGVCTYLVKEFREEDRKNRQQKSLPMYYTLFSMFHVGPQIKLERLMNMIRHACIRKSKGTLNIPRPINKLIHKRRNARKLKKDSAANLYSL